MAFGSSSSTGGANAVAMGYSANASAENAFAIGNTAQSSAQNAVAMGKSANASGVSSFAMGSSSNAAGADAIAMGSSSQAKLSNSIALGGNAKSLGADALALGGAANASKDGAIAIGKEAKANNTNTTAIGLGATVTGTNSMAIGTNAVAESNNSLALGTGTEVRGALVNGYSAFTNQQNNNVANGVVAVGNVGSERRIINVAGGENDTDATNVKQLKFVNSNLAKSIAGPTYMGYEANGSTYKAPDFNIKNSTYHTVKEAVEAAQTNFFSAKGTSADVNYDNTGATGNNATAAGVRTSAAGNFATAVGADATAANANSTAIGYKAKSSVDDGVALGANSVASVAAGKAGYNVKTADSRTNGYSGLTGAALTSTMGAVSVGDGGTKTRQITNVAAGTADTDAVNVAQLRNVNLKVAGNTGKNDVLLDNQTLTVKGDGSYVTTSVNNQTIDVALTDATKNKIDNAANKDLSNITDNGKSVIRDEAQKAVKVVAGKNTTITEGTDGTYKTYKVDVDAPDYQLTENSGAADKAYTVSGNKVDLTVQDAKNPANKKTVTIKDIASKTELDNTKTELINKGLKFDADNGGEKTNKLGSKVTVAGDSTNINTTITQTGDDTTIKVALGQDINVNTVTATKTVKAGTATMGTQSVTDNKSAAQNGNFVSGLDNKNWTLTDPAFVSGRAATEDQLKVVSDAVKAANASASDYRLIANPNNAADGSYKVDNNKVDLQVKDDKSGTVNTVTIKDIASKTELDKVKDRSVKYDGVTGNINSGKVLVNGAKGTVNNLTNITWDADHITSGQAATEDQLKVVDKKITDNGSNLTKKGLNFKGDDATSIHKDLGETLDVVGGTSDKAKLSDNNIGVVSENGKLNVKLAKDLTGLNSVTTGQTTINNNGLTIGGNTFVTNNGFNANNTQIKNVKAGTEDSDAVNLKQLNEVKAASDTKVKAGKNINVEQELDKITNAKTFTVGLKDTVTLGSGSTSVHFDGTTGIIRAGEGSNAVNINGTNGTINSGKVTINGGSGTVNDLTNRTWDPNKITNGQAATEDQLKVVDNKIDKNTENLTKKGLNFKGDSGDKIHKDLGDTLNVTGGEADKSKLSNGNIGVVNENGNLNVKLAKNLKGLDSVTVGSDPNKQVVLDDKGVSVGGKTYISNEGLNANNQKITNVAAGVNDTDAVNVQQLKSSMAAATTTVKAGDSGNTTVETTVNADKSKTYTVDIKKDLNLRSVTTTTDDQQHSTVTNGRGVTSTDTLGNKTALTAGNVQITDGQKNMTQTTAKGVLVDNPTKSTELTVDGVVTTDKKDKSTRTTADGMVVTSGMGSEKVTTTVSSNGVAITTPPAGQGSPKDGTGAVTLTKDGLNNGGNKVVNMASGYGEGEDINNIADNSSSLTNGANIGDLKKGIDGLKKAGLDFAGDRGEFHRDLGQKVTVKGGVTDESKLSTANNIGVISDNNGSLNVRLAKDITGINSITTMDNSGHTTVTNGNGITIKNNGGGSVSLTSSGLNNGGNKITNVAPGEISSTSTDAVNGSQLNRVANSMNNVVNEVRQVGAMSSALSALKPMAYDPYEPTQIMAGYGNYRGDSALALGVAHYKNESMMLHAGVAWAGSNSHMMANAGVTWKVGNRDGEAETADRYRKGPISSTYAMQRELAAMKAENQGLKGEVADLKAENEQMKANIAAMMARLGL